jgi:DNA-binding IclR family transcriptional regulator
MVTPMKSADGSAGPSAVSHEHRTVSRVMAILEVAVASEPNGIRLADLADMVAAPKSSVHGLARGLVATGYLREHQGRYFRGPAVAMLALSGEHIPAAYHHALEELSSMWNETAILATLAGDSAINIDVVEPDQMIRASPPLHTRRPMWPGSFGKVFLAYMEPRRRESHLNRKHKDPEERARITAELEVIRATGVAYNRGETIPDLCGVASPIVIAGIDVTLSIGLSGPITRMVPRLEEMSAAVSATARRLSAQG